MNSLEEPNMEASLAAIGTSETKLRPIESKK